MAASGSGFDMSKMSTASKILLGGSLLLLVDSFLFSWQKLCAEVDLGGIVGTVGGCAKAGMWSGDAGWAGVITGLLAIALLVWEGMQAMGQSIDVGQPASRISAYLGFGVLVFGVLKFLLVLTNHVAFGAFIGLVLILAIGYGAWMRFQEPVAVATTPDTAAPPPATPPADPIA